MRRINARPGALGILRWHRATMNPMSIARLLAAGIVPALLVALLALPTVARAGALADAEAALARGDHQRAVPLLETLAAQGDRAAQFRLGTLHSLGQGLPIDHRQAAAWFARASEAGHHEATVTLANMYLSGLGVPRDEARAMALFERAGAIAEAQAIEDEEC